MNRLMLMVLFAVAIWILSCGSDALAADKSQWQGYLLDRQCAEHVRDDSDPKTFILHHTKDCALMPNCRAKGYSLFVDGKWYEFDKRGNELAVKLLKDSKKKRGFYVCVTGVAQGKLLKVQSMKEWQESKPNNNAEKEKDGNDGASH